MAGWLEVVPDFAPIAAFAHHYELVDGGAVDVVELAPGDLAPGQAAGLVLRGPDGWLDAAVADGYVLLSIEGTALTMAWEPAPTDVLVDATDVLGDVRAARRRRARPPPRPPAAPARRPPRRARDGAHHPPPRPPGRRRADHGGHPRRAGGRRRRAARTPRSSACPAWVSRPRWPPSASSPPSSRSSAATRWTPRWWPSSPTPTAWPRWPSRSSAARSVPQEHLVALVEHLATRGGRRRPGRARVPPLPRWRSGRATPTPRRRPSTPPPARASTQRRSSTPPGSPADRGDAREALGLLRAAHVPADDPDLELLTRYTAAGPNAAGRNDPCWCGSGRKHKQCCLRLNGHDLASRAAVAARQGRHVPAAPTAAAVPARGGHRQRRGGEPGGGPRPGHRGRLRRHGGRAVPVRGRRLRPVPRAAGPAAARRRAGAGRGLGRRPPSDLGGRGRRASPARPEDRRPSAPSTRARPPSSRRPGSSSPSCRRGR